MKKYFEIAKINSQIRSINRELASDSRGPVIISGQIYAPTAQPDRFRETEKSYVLRDALNKLIAEKETIRNR